MPLIVYITDNCESDARRHGLSEEVGRFRERVEECQSTSLFDPFPPGYLVKKKLGGRQGRLIAELHPVGEHAVVVFLAVLIRGSRDYEDEFARDPRAYGEQHFSDLVSGEELARFVEERTRQSPPIINPDPSDSEYHFLYGAFAHHQSVPDDIVCETQRWVEHVAQERVSKQLVLLCKPCLEALERGPGLHFIAVSEERKQGWGVWALRCEGRLLLITPATETTAAEAEAFARQTDKELVDRDAAAILRSSRRAYPALILADEELWIDLENEPVANMALSPEETEILESARGSDSPFPLFINGRAGSGKSTILQYLFADLLFYYLSHSEARAMAPPIYLTANAELLRRARGFVERLLRSEATFTHQSSADSLEDHLTILDEAFRQFQPHLLSLVPPEDRSKQFASKRRIDYPRFRRMWMERFGKDRKALREFGPDLSWHVIRSYVKGLSSETYLEPDDYAQLPENQITATHDAFRLVYERVWSGWYERILEAEGLWDDQDLTRYILDNGLAKPAHPAIFCDEAQDFTRLELELLLRLNLFSNRTLPPNDISRVPFAFAGDQFQTLNPTGFRWDAIKASFVEKFIQALDPARRSGRGDLNFRELEYNYRSTHRIVRFGNHVQATRAALFKLPDLKPQTPWTTEPHSFPVQWFRASDARFWKKFRETNYVVIVPCNEGEEAEYVRSNPILCEHIKTVDGVPVNVLSPARAKGCEYPAVVLYGFGSATQLDVVSALSESNELTSDPDRSLPIQYFINQVYVGVSRAKRRLVVVDTDEGFARLWKCAQEEGAEDLMLARVKNGRQLWGDHIEGMTMGNPDDLSEDTAADPLENARTFEADGLARQDAFLLWQAAQAFRSAGDMPKYRECRARALEAEDRFFEAGDAYFDAGFAVPDGVRCLWRAGSKGWARLCERSAHAAEVRQELEVEWARGIVEKASAREVARIVDRFEKRLDDTSFLEGCIGDPIWRDALAALVEPLIDPALAKISGDPLAQLLRSFDRIRSKGLKLPPQPSATVYFLAGRNPEAIQLWEELSPKPSEYFQAKASLEPYPQRVLSLSKLGLTDDIVRAYDAFPNVPMNSEQASVVVDVLCNLGRRSDAVKVAWNARATPSLLRMALLSLRAGDTAAARSALHSSLALLAEQGQWGPVTAFASSLTFGPDAAWNESDAKEFVRSEGEAMQVTMVRALARSGALPDAPSHVQRQLSDFLRRYLRVKEGSWRTEISIFEAGAAFERAGRFTDAIGFYEAVLNGRPSEDERQFARRRWLMCKQRQLEYESAQGVTRKVRDIEQEVQKMKAAWRISDDMLPHFPELTPPEGPLVSLGKTAQILDQPPPLPVPAEPPLPETTAPGTNDVVISAGPFRIEVSRKNQRCNITHTETMETAYVKIADRCCGGEALFTQPIGKPNRWVCEPWNLGIQFLESPEGGLSVDLAEFGVALEVRP